VKVVDLTHQLFHGMAVYPGHPGVEIADIKTIHEHRRSLQHLKMTNHAGTHIDAPSHFIEGGDTVDKMDLASLMGPARIIDLTDKSRGDTISVQDLLPCEEAFTRGSRVLLKTGWDSYFIREDYYTDYPVLAVEAARWIASRRISLLGMDMPSPGPRGDTGEEIHQVLLAGGVVLVESLHNLSLVGNHTFTFMALPMNIRSCSGSPCRAIAILEEQ